MRKENEGTFVDGAQIGTDWVQLRNGTQLRLGPQCSVVPGCSGFRRGSEVFTSLVELSFGRKHAWARIHPWSGHPLGDTSSWPRGSKWSCKLLFWLWDEDRKTISAHDATNCFISVSGRRAHRRLHRSSTRRLRLGMKLSLRIRIHSVYESQDQAT